MNGSGFRRLAIVNRGEAAMRCIRAVKTLRAEAGYDLQVIALYTEVERDAPFVRHADFAVEIPSPNGAVAAYLNHDTLLAALREAGADAVWPGWGFVAEDSAFVAKLLDAGITFLGPSADAMHQLGDKISSKELAERAGVPVTDWSHRAIQDEEDATALAERIGYPLVVKASAGGGGRGIRMVDTPDALAEAVRGAAAEALGAFGDDRLFIEARVENGRHIEVQIAADLQGNVVAIGSRDCSVQRRNQKVIEEAPPPGLDAEQIGALEAAAVRLAGHVSYTGVGTVEFLLSEEGFYFLEVNPRLQVEHGITEEVTGIDLVQLQIRIALGESIKDLRPVCRGVALEARVCAEDPDAGFLPSPGMIVRFDAALGPRVRIDSGIAADTLVPPDFDSLLAKVIATGSTREEARARLSCALQDFELVVRGGATNKGYLIELLEAKDFRDGPVDTGWLDRWNEDRSAQPAARLDLAPDALVAAAILAYQRERGEAREHFYADTTGISPERIPPNSGQQVDLTHVGESYRLMVYAIGSWRYRVHLDGRAVTAKMKEEGKHGARLEIDNRVHRILYDADELGLRIEVGGSPHRYGWHTAGQVRAGTPAILVALQIEVGDRVEVGQSLGLVEAMKMEIAFQAPVSGIVTEIHVREGQQLAAGEVVLTIDPASEDEDAGPAATRLQLPEQRDPLALLFREKDGNPLAAPDLEAADQLAKSPSADGRSQWKVAMSGVRNEMRRVLLGYDANPERCESLLAFLDAPLPEGLSQDGLFELGEIHHELIAFADVEQLFIRAPQASISGELGPSNNARLRMYVRRMRAEGAGIADEFLDLVRKAISHYGVDDLTPGDALERAVLRMLSTQFKPDLRRRLAASVLGRITAVAEAGLDLSGAKQLSLALTTLTRMRGLVTDATADAAIEARYVIFERVEVERAAQQSSEALESWLEEAERLPTAASAPSPGMLMEVAAAARRVFDRVGRWIKAPPDLGRLEIALAAHVQRLYAPRLPVGRISLRAEGTWIHVVNYADQGEVLAATAGEAEIKKVANRLCDTARRRSEQGQAIFAIELLVPDEEGLDTEALRVQVGEYLSSARPLVRFTLSLHAEDSGRHFTWSPAETADAPISYRDDFYEIHPETAERIDLGRYREFLLERIPSEEGIYTFHGRSREVEADERVFVLADARERALSAGTELEAHISAFERVFNRAARSLRTTLSERDPRRELQWNRIAIYVSAEIALDEAGATRVARQLVPATRHLGLEKVLVRLNLLDSENAEGAVKPVEIVISQPTRDQMQLSWRTPHHDPLEPAREYERRVVAARRRRLVYPYEIIRMLTSDRQDLEDESDRLAIPPGEFEEYDLETATSHDAPLLRDLNAAPPRPKAVSVKGREPGGNQASVVFGVLSTPTDKVPEGMRRVLVLSDPTMGMGALSIPECDRLVAAIDLAEKLGVPVEWLPVSSGAKIAMDSGTENLDATARVVRRIVTYTQGGGIIHLIVQGMNVGAQAYFDALATMLMHCQGVLIMTPRASMVLTGRAALEASGSVSAEDEVAIGGFEQIMGPNGQAQYYARNLAEAYRCLYDYYRVSYVVPGEVGPRHFETTDPIDRSISDSILAPAEAFDFATVGEIFDDATNPGRKRPFEMRAVMGAVIDRDCGYLERWHQMVAAETAIVWDAHLGGQPLTMIGIESHVLPREGYRPVDGPEAWNGGTLFPHSSKKVARAINAASGNRPVVVLANLSGFDGSPESLRKLQLEYGAEIARAVVNFEGTILFLVVSRYHGGAYVVFSQELNDGLRAAALSGSYASVIGGSAAATVVFKRDVRARALADPRVSEKQQLLRRHPSPEARKALDVTVTEVMLEKQREVADEFDSIHSVERAQRVGSLEQIIAPSEIRSHLISELRRHTPGNT